MKNGANYWNWSERETHIYFQYRAIKSRGHDKNIIQNVFINKTLIIIIIIL